MKPTRLVPRLLSSRSLRGVRATAATAGVVAALTFAPSSGADPDVPRFPPGRAPAAFVCTLPPGRSALPASARRGLIRHLPQYPTVSLATPRERAAAQRLLDDLRTAARRWSSPRAAQAAGFDTRTVRRRLGDTRAHYLHAEWRHERPGARLLDVRRPKALIFANEPGRQLVLVGVMFSMQRGERGRSPGGPIMRWHSHDVCSLRGKRGLKPRADGSCPPGATRRQGSEMMHVWFTGDLRSAFAVRAPERELCRDGLIVGRTCDNPSSGNGM